MRRSNQGGGRAQGTLIQPGRRPGGHVLGSGLWAELARPGPWGDTEAGLSPEEHEVRLLCGHPLT